MVCWAKLAIGTSHQRCHCGKFLIANKLKLDGVARIQVPELRNKIIDAEHGPTIDSHDEIAWHDPRSF